MAVVDAAACLLMVALTVLSLAVYLFSKRRKEEEGKVAGKVPPGPRGLPLLGYLPFIKSNIAHCFADLARTYGPVMGFRLGTRFCVVLSSPGSVKEALKDHDLVFASHDVPAAVFHSVYKNEDMLWAPYGPHWRAMRKMAVRELLSPANIEGLSSTRRREVGRMVDEVRRRHGEPVKLEELISSTALNAITMMIWGRRVSAEGDELGKEFIVVMETMIWESAAPNVSDFFPALAWLDLQGLGQQTRRTTAWLDRVLNVIIERRLREPEGKDEEGSKSTPTSKGRDFMQVVVEHLQNGDSESPLTTMHIKALLMNLVGAGLDTTTTVVEWAMAELLCHPHVMAKVKGEIAAVIDNTKATAVEEYHLPMLHYLDAVVKEVLRLHPVVPLLIPYRPSSTCTIGGYQIPEGTKVFINVWAIHRDPHIWEHASVFLPERFLKEGSNLDGPGNSFHYLHFGSGRRIRPGISLAERMTKLILATLLHNFEWSLPNGGESDLTEKFGIVLKLEKPLVAVPTPL